MSNKQSQLDLIKNSIITIPNYPKEGIMFRDITSLLNNPIAFKTTIELLVDQYRNKKIDKVVGTEARGFIFAAPVALALNAGFIPVRKPHKLPRHVFKEEYQLEYGKDALEIHTDAINPGEKVLMIDDLLATGGTIAATTNLIRKAGGIVEDAAFVINLVDLPGKTKLDQMGINCFTLVEFRGE